MERFLNKVIEGDCLKVMPLIPDKSIDMILCDLPYGTTQNKWDIVIPFELLWKQYKRIIKNNGAILLFGQEPFSSFLRMSNIEQFKYDWIWEKSQSRGFLNAWKQPLRDFEIISVFYKNQPFYNPQLINKPEHNIRSKTIRTKSSNNYGNHNMDIHKNSTDKSMPKQIIKFNNCQEYLHPTQKPLDLIIYLLNTHSNENDIVLDNCAGSGTTGEACLETGRNYVLIEKEKKYVDIINNRIEKFKEQGRLF